MTDEDLREKIVDAAARLIRSDGLGSATTRRIAEEAGIALPVLHYCFNSKDALLEAVFERQTDWDLADLSVHIAPGAGLGAAVRALLENMTRAVLDNGSEQISVFEVAAWAMRTGRVADARYEQWLSHVRALFETARTGRSGEDQVDLDMLSRTVFALVDGLNMHDKLSSDGLFARSVGAAGEALAIAVEHGAFRSAR